MRMAEHTEDSFYHKRESTCLDTNPSYSCNGGVKGQKYMRIAVNEKTAQSYL